MNYDSFDSLPCGAGCGTSNRQNVNPLFRSSSRREDTLRIISPKVSRQIKEVAHAVRELAYD